MFIICNGNFELNLHLLFLSIAQIVCPVATPEWRGYNAAYKRYAVNHGNNFAKNAIKMLLHSQRGNRELLDAKLDIKY